MYILNIQPIRYAVERLKGERDRVTADAEASETKVATYKLDAERAEEARAIIQTVAQATQKELEYHVSEIVSLALAAVFEHPYSLRLMFVQRRNKTEADIFFERDGEQFKPIDASGGGAVDIAAFALRVAMWSLRRPRSRSVLILDEPGKFISVDLRPKMGAMLKEISKRLDLQMIVVSHAEEYIEASDKCFHVSIHNGVSKVVEIDKEDNYASKGTASKRRSTEKDIRTPEKTQLFPQIQQNTSTSRQGDQKQSSARGRRRN